jgi:hypothetical protein
MRKILLILPLLALLVIVGCTKYVPEETTEPVTDQTEETTEAETVEQAMTFEDGIKYTDSVYGFYLELPKEWKGFDVKTETISWGEEISGKAFYFGFETWDDIFAISTLEKNVYDANFEGEDLTLFNKIGESDKYVFGTASSQDLIDPELEERFAEYSDIIKTFKVQ